ncbi:MAG TPA: sigma 54-interacting transcriptional regulator [Thermoanaerobaculia bacterium]
MIRLVVSFEDGQQRFNVPLNVKRTIGSAADNDFVVAWPGVSKHHATVERVGEWLLIKDSGSKNGIVVDGERRDRAHLRPGETARIGRASISVEEIPTSDADVVFAFGDHSSSVGAGATQTASGGEDERVVAAAMRWVRDAASTPLMTAERRRTLLESAAAIARTRSLLICTKGTDLALNQIVGTLTDDDDLDALASANASGTRWFAVPLGKGMMLAAHPKDTEHFSVWQREFIEHAGNTLFASQQGSDRFVAIPEGEIIFPETMVLGGSAAMAGVHERVRMAVQSGLNTLLRGESGTGKELIARAIHASTRRSGAFRAINCAAVPNDLFESEMFGIRSGVATGVEKRVGHFIEAEGGTIFLDEVGDLSQVAQAKLLRVIQEREVLPVGASTPVKIDVRVVASTNRDLEALIHNGLFRADLYYRLRGIEIVIPPLRNRRDDIPALAVVFATRVAKRVSKRLRGVSRKALSRLSAYQWPGNVRELENVIEQAIMRCLNGGTLESAHLDLPIQPAGSHDDSLKTRKTSMEDSTIDEALKRTKGNKQKAATLLGISRQALYEKLKRRKP